ncbi:Deoxyribose-phosphate aldolase, partial [Fragariocoptes setiger]
MDTSLSTPVRLPKPSKDEPLDETEPVEPFYQLESPRMSLMDNKDLRILFRQFTWNISTMRDMIRHVKYYCSKIGIDEEYDLLLLAVRCIDLTTLAGDDTITNVERVCYRAIAPLIDDDDNSEDELTADPVSRVSSQLPTNGADIKCAAVCVYPARVVDCHNTLAKLRRNPADRVKIAAVATGFPSGQYGLKSRLSELQYAVESGANEIDVVINRAAAISGDWLTVHRELCEMISLAREMSDENDPVHVKVIIGAGDLLSSTPRTIFLATLVSILAGADFVKTSTGKENVNATLPIGYFMMRAVLDYYLATGVRVGFKPAGGIRKFKDALHWLILVKHLLGPVWLSPTLFRFGASGLLDSLVTRIRQLEKQKDKRVCKV